MERRIKLRFEHNMWEHISKLYFEQFFYFLISFFTKNFLLIFIVSRFDESKKKILCKKTNRKIEKVLLQKFRNMFPHIVFKSQLSASLRM